MLPDGWEKKSLRDVVEFTNGKAHEQEITNVGKYIVVNSRFISSNGDVTKHSDSINCPAQKDDILIVMSDVPNGRAIARCFLVDKDQKYTVNQRVGLLRPRQINPLYLLYALNRNPYFLRFDDGIKQTNLRKDEVLECPILMPNPFEQKNIVQVLSAWAATVDHLEILLKKKQKQKKALAQRLLSGKQRFPEFEKEPWPLVSMESLFKEVTIKVGESNAIPHSISAGIGFVSHVDKWGKDISGGQYQNYTMLKNGQFAYNKGNSKKYRCGCMYLYKGRNPIAVPNVFISFERRNSKVCNEFFEQYFMADYCARELKRYITSGARADGLLNLNKKDYFSIKVPSPSTKEQQVIAKTLTQADYEITLLNHKLEALKEQKKGLMQRLLTGKKRLKVKDREAA